MNETLFFDKAHETEQARRWSRRSVKADVVPLRFGTEESYEWREREILRSGDLGTYKRLAEDRKTDVWIIAHVPTGYQVGPTFTSKADAVLFMYLVRDLDWSFTSPNHEHTDEFRSRVREASRQADAIFTPSSLSEGWNP